MASGDVAASYGFTVVSSTEDIKLGYSRINDAADFAASLAGAVNGPAGTLGTGMTLVSALIRKVKNRVLAQAYLSCSTTAAALAAQVIYTLPAGYRPPTVFGTSGTVHVLSATTHTPVALLVSSDGTIAFHGTAASGSVDRVSFALAFDIA